MKLSNEEIRLHFKSVKEMTRYLTKSQNLSSKKCTDTREESLNVDLDQLTISHITDLTISKQECLCLDITLCTIILQGKREISFIDHFFIKKCKGSLH